MIFKGCSPQTGHPKNTTAMLKHGSGSIMLVLFVLNWNWEFNQNRSNHGYRQISVFLVQNLLGSDSGRQFYHSAHNDPNHKPKSAEQWLQKKINILEWRSQSTDLNPIKSLECFWNILKWFDEGCTQYALPF